MSKLTKNFSAFIYNNNRNVIKKKELSQEYIKQFKEINARMLLIPGKYSHIELRETEDSLTNYRGIAFVRAMVVADTNEPKYTLRIATKEEITNANVLAFGGIDFDSSRYLSALIKAAKQLGDYQSREDALNKICNVIAIAPEVSRVDRYQAAEEYSFNPKHQPSYITKRVEEYVLPKILDEKGNINFNIPISFFSFSVGGREIMMMENALRDILKNNYSNITSDERKKIMNSFKAVCLGYAADPDYIASKEGFTKLIIFSVDDTGVLRPASLCSKILWPSIHIDESFVINSLGSESEICQSGIIVINHEAMPHEFKGKVTSNFHSLPHYIQGIGLAPECIQQTIGELLTADDIDIIGSSTDMSHP